MRCARGRVAKRPTNLREAGGIEPTLLDAMLDRPAIGAKLAAAHVVMPAFVMEDEQLHGSGLARNKHRIEHQKLRVRYRYAKIVQARVQHAADVTTAQGVGRNPHTAVRFQANGRCSTGSTSAQSPRKQGGDSGDRKQTP
jgi:hypothetical protein